MVPSRIVLEFVDAIPRISKVPSQEARSIGRSPWSVAATVCQPSLTRGEQRPEQRYRRITFYLIYFLFSSRMSKGFAPILR
jgi:hypothetical protein